VWQVASDLVYSANLGFENSRTSRGRNPLAQYYRTADDRWIVIALLESDKWWARFATAVGLEARISDPIWVDAAAREANFEVCRDELVAHFATQPLDVWRERLAEFTGPWEPIQSMLEVADDRQVVANDYVRTMTAANGTDVRLVAAPMQFDGAGGRLLPCPEAGAQTEEVLLEYGLGWDEIIQLKESGGIT
jgi:crotonobetainyl-CoA:carnitine CoA-transferase CaiB-like acyl-CoA transferase